ncbi:TetR/AcrR family transcriptional regulator [Agromyces atrinae]|uniref:TetR/AcrR family transcriptional regulator n=1 Tax=Agromyces atrinae TaxID=592376 RepID=UPI001F5652A3|nr:TetR/AcrR family transcriptional regulator [Agromyces atrinae]MCI2956192.1 TetR/AcrR family transcriptional regulator [Agromyces atrinae]
MTDTATPTRYANGLARRAQIVEAARELFISDGFRAVSLRDIAARAGLSHPGLLRHFSSKDEILAEIVAALEAPNEAEIETVADDAVPLEDIVQVARRNQTTPGYLELFMTLAGEATVAGHPTHGAFRDRYRRLLALSAERIEAGRDAGRLPGVTDPRGESIRLAAAWDGLQLMSLYTGGAIDPATHLARHAAQLRGDRLPAVDAVATAPPLPPVPVDAEAAGYRPGRENRRTIVAAATALFARGGFHATSLREIGEQAGVPKSTLLHHFSSKDDLLIAVLEARDAEVSSVPLDDGSDPLERVGLIIAEARRSAREFPGLIEFYVVLSCEAATPSHPAHEYFRHRYELVRAHFVGLFRQLAAAGHLAPGRDAEHEGVWLVALWDGLQIQWLYDPDAVDVAAELSAYFEQVLA